MRGKYLTSMKINQFSILNFSCDRAVVQRQHGLVQTQMHSSHLRVRAGVSAGKTCAVTV